MARSNNGSGANGRDGRVFVTIPIRREINTDLGKVAGRDGTTPTKVLEEIVEKGVHDRVEELNKVGQVR